LLNIHSPSGVFADIGKNMALGLSNGFSQQMTKATQEIEEEMKKIKAKSTKTATNKKTENSGSESQAGLSKGVSTAKQVFDPKNYTYQAFFQTYNEREFFRALRKTDLLYGQ
jgi:hypothetical protein